MDINKSKQIIIPKEFPRINDKDLWVGDILLFIGGNKLTEWHGKHRTVSFGRSDTPPYHAAIVADVAGDRVFILDQELLGNFSLLEEYTTKKELRIDVIRVMANHDKTSVLRKSIQKLIYEIGTKEKMYDWKGFLYFIKQMPYCKWLPVPKPSKNTFYCSDVVAYCWQKHNIQVSPRSNDFTAPVDLQLYGYTQSSIDKYFECYTLKLKGELAII